MRPLTHFFRSLDAAWIVYTHFPLVQSCDGPDRLTLLLGQTGVLVVSYGASCQLKQPS